MVASHDIPAVLCTFCHKPATDAVAAGTVIPADPDFKIGDNFVYADDGTLDFIELFHVACTPTTGGWRPSPERHAQKLGAALMSRSDFRAMPGMVMRNERGVHTRIDRRGVEQHRIEQYALHGVDIGVPDLRDAQTAALVAVQARDQHALYLARIGVVAKAEYAVLAKDDTWEIHSPTLGRSAVRGHRSEGMAWAAYYLLLDSFQVTA